MVNQLAMVVYLDSTYKMDWTIGAVSNKLDLASGTVVAVDLDVFGAAVMWDLGSDYKLVDENPEHLLLIV